MLPDAPDSSAKPAMALCAPDSTVCRSGDWPYNGLGRNPHPQGAQQAMRKAPGRRRSMGMGLPLTVLLAVSVTALAGDGDAKDQPARFKITTKRKDDRVEVKAEKDRAVFAVKS